LACLDLPLGSRSGVMLLVELGSEGCGPVVGQFEIIGSGGAAREMSLFLCWTKRVQRSHNAAAYGRQ
jgi:hypothetical protein